MAGRMLACYVVLCAALFVACYAGTGSDERNMRSFYSYPQVVRDTVSHDSRLAGMVPRRRSWIGAFVCNLLVFTVALVLVRLVARPESFAATFVGLLAVGEGLNLFDLVVIDLLWWRRSPRVQFSAVGDGALYRDARPHVASFLRGIPMFALAALLASL